MIVVVRVQGQSELAHAPNFFNDLDYVRSDLELYIESTGSS